MAASKKPKIVYSWVTIRPSKRSKQPVRVECTWSLVGANGEHMCSSFPEGYGDKTDARRAVQSVISVFYAQRVSGPYPDGIPTVETLRLIGNFREVGPGPKPKVEA